MAVSIRQHTDGSMSLLAENDSIGVLRVGGLAPTPGTAAKYRGQIYAQIPLVAGTDTAGGIVAWAIPTEYNTNGVLINDCIIDVTTIATAACSVSIGVAANATTSSANLIDTLDVHSATGTFDNYTDKGTNGKSRQKFTSGKYVTVSTASGASAGLVGTLTIGYVPL